jgi:hypothetical protein
MGILPAATVVANIAPREMKAPANSDNMNMVNAGISALRTPRYSARVAISAGRRASILISLIGLSFSRFVHATSDKSVYQH